jgi:bifunctional DNA-binding transcriptional regulator/antitoxin component of YhaV-PrlF toxin-antitoxin module
MVSLTITSKGQVTLRKDILRHLGVVPGAKVSVEKLPNGRVEVRALPGSGSMEDFIGFLKRENGHCASIEEINEAAAAGWAGER